MTSLRLSQPGAPPAHTPVCAPAASLASAFAEVSETFAGRSAVTFGAEELTYSELAQAAARTALALRDRGVAPGDIVAIYLPRGIDMVVAMLGVVQAGAAYLPMDPGYPVARIQETLEDASPALVLTDNALASGLTPGTPLLLMNAMPATPTDVVTRHDAKSEDVAYIIYTSGSTGRPKGVMVSHHNVLRLLTQTAPWFHFNECDVWTMFHSFAFDFSVWEMWGSLLSGGRLVIVPFEVSRSPEDFLKLLVTERVTVLNQTPSAFSLIAHVATTTPPIALSLRYIIFGGEALNLRALLPWMARYGDATPQLINMYGITETTVHVTYRRILEADAAQESDSLIGEPIPDLQIHLLDDALRPVRDGEVGEMSIGGDGVALGYLRRPELTAERFIQDPAVAEGARLYRSGDLARRRQDGELVYLGRADHQVKINGFRIELGEIESVISTFPGITQTCVLAEADSAQGQQLVAFYVATAPQFDFKVLSKHIGDSLPSHMRPSRYVRVEAMSLTGNGKIDRKALLLTPVPQAVPAPPHSTAGMSVEGRVATVWASVLQRGEIAADDNFFDIGGTSLRLIAARTALQQEFGVAIPVTWMFEHTTVRSLAAKLAETSTTQPPQIVEVKNKARQQREAFARMRATRSMAS